MPKMFGSSFKWLGAAALLACLAAATLSVGQSSPSEPAQVADEASLRRAQLQKLQLEIDSLKRAEAVPLWLSVGGSLVTGMLIGLVSAGSAFYAAYRGRLTTVELANEELHARIDLAHRERIAALDRTVHEKRLEAYTGLVAATEPLALLFPPAAMLSPCICEGMGNRLRAWYFQQGGLLMTKESRQAYFALGRALTRAARADRLAAPHFPADSLRVSVELVDQYRDTLGTRLDDVEGWQFGITAADSAPAAERFRDYVFLQRLSSRLRSVLANDMESRRPPEAG